MNLRVESHQPVHAGWFDNEALDGLSFRDRSIADLEALGSLKLRRLDLAWSEMSLEHVPPSVEWLSLTRWAALSVRRLEPLWRLPRLESLRLINVDLTTLAKVAKLPALTSLEAAS
ncbi:MAG TPA: hypothetical protein VH560_01825, partial [Polyangia bacterium]|nr:hypothetical protein [Polyangia bacterium]